MIGTGKFAYITDPRNEKHTFESKLNAAVKRFYGLQRPIKQVPVKRVPVRNMQKFNGDGISSNTSITRSKSLNIKSVSNKFVVNESNVSNSKNSKSFSSKNKNTKSILKSKKSHRFTNSDDERLTVGPFRLPSSRTTSYITRFWKIYRLFCFGKTWNTLVSNTYTHLETVKLSKP